MVTQDELRHKLRKIEALFEGAGTPGERVAAEAALVRLAAKLKKPEASDPLIEFQVTPPDQWSRQLFIALCRRYDLKPYRYAHQRRTSVVVRAPRSFFEDVLLRQFRDLDAELRAYLNEVTLKIIREEIHSDASDAAELPEALPAA